MVSILAAMAITAAIIIGRAYHSEADQRTKAEQTVRLAADAIDRTLTRAAKQQYTKGQVQFAESLAADATSLYEQLLAKSDDADLRFRAANALVQVAQIRLSLAQHELAQAAYARASQLLTPLAQAYPERDDYLFALAAIESGHAQTLASLGRHAEAADPYRRALAVAEKLVRRFPGDVSYQFALADRLNNLGVALTFSDCLDEAEECFERSAAT
jgi:tetratricopeptide (TPR) repeat protein